MPHKLIDTNKLHFQDGYNIIRSPKEFKDNAADVEKQMEQMGDEPASFPVNYVVIDGTFYTRNHATLQAALNRNWPKVYAMESAHAPGSTADILDLILSNNRSHPVSRAKQGEVYKMLRDGEGPGPEEIAAAPVGEEPKNKRDPMTPKEIAAACNPVYSEMQISHCITLAESSPEIQELMETDQVSANIVIKAAQWSVPKKGEEPDEKKQLRILKAAIRQADAEGAKKATQKHMDAIKSEFVKLKADKPTEPEGKLARASAPSIPSTWSDDENKGDTAPELPAGNEEEQELFTHSVEVTTEGSDKNTKLRAAWTTILMDSENMEDTVLDPETVEAIVEKLHAAMIAARDVF